MRGQTDTKGLRCNKINRANATVFKWQKAQKEYNTGCKNINNTEKIEEERIQEIAKPENKAQLEKKDQSTETADIPTHQIELLTLFARP